MSCWCLAQGHFGMQSGGDGDQTPDLLVSGQPALPTSARVAVVMWDDETVFTSVQNSESPAAGTIFARCHSRVAASKLLLTEDLKCDTHSLCGRPAALTLIDCAGREWKGPVLSSCEVHSFEFHPLSQWNVEEARKKVIKLVLWAHSHRAGREQAALRTGRGLCLWRLERLPGPLSLRLYLGALTPLLNRLKGISQVPEFLNTQGGNSGPSGPWHSSSSLWKIHFPWLKGFISSPLIPQSAPQQRVKGQVPGSRGQESSRHDDGSLPPGRIPSCLKDRGTQGGISLSLCMDLVCYGWIFKTYRGILCYCSCFDW